MPNPMPPHGTVLLLKDGSWLQVVAPRSRSRAYLVRDGSGRTSVVPETAVLRRDMQRTGTVSVASLYDFLRKCRREHAWYRNGETLRVEQKPEGLVVSCRDGELLDWSRAHARRCGFCVGSYPNESKMSLTYLVTGRLY